MDIELLGTPGVRGDEGERPRIAGRQQVLLSVLALHAPRAVSADTLLEAVWGEDLPADPGNALQQRISSLRKVLSADLLVTAANGYALRIDDDAIDARRFARRAGGGARLLAEGDAVGARDELEGALALWRGEALQGYADEPWARPDAHRLTELRLSAIEDRNDAVLAVGGGAELVPELVELLGDHPLRERMVGQLMVALYRAGRQGEALEVYDALRRRLADELGVDPGPAVQALYRRVLDQDALLSPDRPAEPHVDLRTSSRVDTRVDNLPAPTQAIVGRDEQVGKIDELLAASRCVTITGPGGTGKTTVALELARRRPRPVHGTWFVDLSSVSRADAIVAELAAVLGLGGGFSDAPATVERVGAALADRQLLLVLDNCEHVAAELGPLLGELLAAASGLTVLSTSREPLGIAGEQLVPLPPLEVPDPDETDVQAISTTAAVALLTARARQHDPWFTLGPSSAADAAALVRHLDGIPLAIELAAAQLRVLSLPELTTSLRDRLELLENPVRTAPARQRTLRGALDWSWDLLEPIQQRAWAALSVAASRFDADIAERLLAAAGVDRAHHVVVRELAERSVLTIDARSGAAPYRMLETVRLYGRERLAALELDDDVRSAHAALIDDALAACHTSADPAVFGVDLGGLRDHVDDGRAALAWADSAGKRPVMQRIAANLGWLWLLGGHAAEGLGWLERSLVADGDVEVVEPAAVLWAAALSASSPLDDDRWVSLAVEVATEPAQLVFARVYAAVALAKHGQLEEMAAELASARGAAEAIGGWPLGFCLLIGAQLGRLTGRFDEVGRDAEAARHLLAGPGLEWARAYATDILIDAVLGGPGDAHQRFTRARDLASDGLALCSGRRLPELEARLRLQLGRALHALGDTERARRYLDDAVRLAAAGGPGIGLGFALLAAGSVARQRGELDEARTRLLECVELLGGTGLPYGSTEAHIELALVALAGGDGSAARDAASASLVPASVMGDPGTWARALEVAAVVPATQLTPDLDDAVAFLAAAACVRERSAVPLDPVEAADRALVIRWLGTASGDEVGDRVELAVSSVGRELDAVLERLVERYGHGQDRAVTGP